MRCLSAIDVGLVRSPSSMKPIRDEITMLVTVFLADTASSAR